MEKWEIVVRDFLKDWKSKRYVIGALLCGSYVTGNPSSHSDLDVYIIMDNSIRWRERGNRIIDGFLVEYFANPVEQVKNYFREEFEKRSQSTAHMIVTGKILFDKSGKVKELKKEARKLLGKTYSKMSASEISSMKYGLWDLLDNLEEVFDECKDDFFFVYHIHLNELLSRYSKFLKYDKIHSYKVRSFFESAQARKKYCLSDFPDLVFQNLFLKAMKTTDKKEAMDLFRMLTSTVLDKMGGFDIDGWKLRSSF